jgi:hypothetical protein
MVPAPVWTPHEKAPAIRSSCAEMSTGTTQLMLHNAVRDHEDCEKKSALSFEPSAPPLATGVPSARLPSKLYANSRLHAAGLPVAQKRLQARSEASRNVGAAHVPI